MRLERCFCGKSTCLACAKYWALALSIPSKALSIPSTKDPEKSKRWGFPQGPLIGHSSERPCFWLTELELKNFYYYEPVNLDYSVRISLTNEQATHKHTWVLILINDIIYNQTRICRILISAQNSGDFRIWTGPMTNTWEARETSCLCVDRNSMLSQWTLVPNSTWWPPPTARNSWSSQ